MGKKWMEKGAVRERGVGEGLMPYHMAKDSNPLQRLIRAENLHRGESRKPSLAAFSQLRTVSSIEPSISSMDDILLKWFS